jgi:hypothetical protein
MTRSAAHRFFDQLLRPGSARLPPRRGASHRPALRSRRTIDAVEPCRSRSTRRITSIRGSRATVWLDDRVRQDHDAAFTAPSSAIASYVTIGRRSPATSLAKPPPVVQPVALRPPPSPSTRGHQPGMKPHSPIDGGPLCVRSPDDARLSTNTRSAVAGMGIAVDAERDRLFVSSLWGLEVLDLKTDRLIARADGPSAIAPWSSTPFATDCTELEVREGASRLATARGRRSGADRTRLTVSVSVAGRPPPLRQLVGCALLLGRR